MAARGDVKGILGNEWRMKSELARITQVADMPTLPQAQDYLIINYEGSGSNNMHKEGKAAQRGPNVTQAYLEGLLRAPY